MEISIGICVMCKFPEKYVCVCIYIIQNYKLSRFVFIILIDLNMQFKPPIIMIIIKK